MPTHSLDAFTLRSYPLGESDRIVVLFSREQGLGRAVAKGARKSGSSLAGRIEPLVRCRFLLADCRGLDIVSQCETVRAFPALRRDLSRLMQALCLAELTMAALGEGSPHPEAFDRFDEALHSMCRLDPQLVALWYQLKLLEDLGYRPSFDFCVLCGAPIEGESFFSPQEGGAMCCRGGLRLSPLVRETLSLLQEAGVSSLDSLHPGKEVLGDAHRLLGEHIKLRIDARLKASSLLPLLG
ncbi:MAG TPA: DNA repair protein RecO [Chroococcales cyanobacterium]|jgi:DNA repair protein RecO (recombination protein O)